MSLLIPLSPGAVPHTRSAPSPIFALSYGAATAVVHDGRRISYADLSRSVDDFAATHYGPSRRLVLIEADNDLDTVVAYLAALNHGHVALMAPAGAELGDLLATYDPDVIVGGTVQQRRVGSAHRLHPDLALLLSTSGSTGSPKLVRLSRENLSSNAESIADYLGLRHDDRAVTSLPLHYCYGLSVLHSHLTRGAGVVLTDLSVVDECFWRLCEQEAVTTLSGVPYTFELLNRSGFAERTVPMLRRVTQAGGKLRPAEITRFAELAQRQGYDFFVMYGQTEATARMAYLPPDLAMVRSDAVGVAIPGGHLRIDPVAGEAPGVGEVVYSGPNVMLGYARSAADLARGRDVHELHTGDIGEIRDGLLHIVGRRNRCAKVFGLRLDLDRIEAGLSRVAHVVPGEDCLTVVGTHADMPRLATEVAAACRLPASAVRWRRVDDVPLRANGKPDLKALAELVRDSDVAPVATGSLAEQVRGHFSTVLGTDAPDDDATFASLGGDSLSYVELATRLEACLPDGLPADWHQRTLAELGRPQAERRSRRWLARQDTTIALRAFAILLIIGSHVELIDLMGGAHLLLAIAGFNFARFTLDSHPDGRLRRTLASLATIVVPTSLWIGAVALLSGKYDWPTALYLNGLLGGERWTDDSQFWFMEALIWPTFLAALILAWRPLARLERRSPFGIALAMLGVAAALRFALVGVEADSMERYDISATAFFFVLGWVASRARDTRERLLLSGLALVLVPGFFGMPERESVVVLGLLVVCWLPVVALPRSLARVSGHIATYSLCIYVTHWVVYPPLEVDHPVLAVLASIVVGTAYGMAILPLQRRVSQIIRPAHQTPCPSWVAQS